MNYLRKRYGSAAITETKHKQYYYYKTRNNTNYQDIKISKKKLAEIVMSYKLLSFRILKLLSEQRHVSRAPFYIRWINCKSVGVVSMLANLIRGVLSFLQL